MHSAQPLDILFEEAGASLGRIERELRLKDEARAARSEARLAAIELAAFKSEEERQRKFEARMAELRDGKDGEPGRDGRDADIEPLRDEVGDFLSKAREELSLDLESMRDAVESRLAEVKDGKDGEPGKDGKDADIQSLKEDLHLFKSNTVEHINTYMHSALNKVNEQLAEVKDGKDGAPGKDADIVPLLAEIEDVKEQVLVDLRTAKEAVFESVDSRLDELKDGRDGKDGEPGPPGKDGKLPISREWTDRVHYEGDVVRHNGATYQALANTGREPPHSDWGELVSRGKDGLGFVLRGTYDASADYKQHDIVMINRNSFAAKYDSPGECPGDGWQLFGPSGQRGKEGPPGQKGEPGKDGRSISVTKWEADPDEMVLRVTDSSGDTFAIDLQPIAERIVEAAR